MPDYHTYLMRHGESWIQSLVENIEKSRGINDNTMTSLETRWVRVMQQDDETVQAKAA